MAFARDGLREMLVCTLLFGGSGFTLAVLAWKSSPWFAIPAVLLLGIWIFTLAFFRDPHRAIPGDPGLLVSPADGTVTDVTGNGFYLRRSSGSLAIFAAIRRACPTGDATR